MDCSRLVGEGQAATHEGRQRTMIRESELQRVIKDEGFERGIQS
jgi:hypothetical protein